MFFILSKMLGLLTKPFSLILIFVGASYLTHNAKWRKRLRWTALILFLVFSNGIVFNECLLLWERPAIPLAELDDDYHLAIVLGGTTDVDRGPHDRLYFFKGAERVTHALNLYHAGKVKKILFTGGNARLFESSERDNSPIFNFYVMCGVAPEDIMIESSSRNTRENAFFVKNMLEEEGGSGRVLLLTSSYHMRRAQGCFEKVGIDVTGFSTDFYSALPKDRINLTSIIPSLNVLNNWSFLIKEWIGYVAYKAMGYL